MSSRVMVYFGEAFGGDPAVDIVEGIPEAIANHRVHVQSPMRWPVRECGRTCGAAHVFLAPGDDQFGTAAAIA